MPRKNPPPNPAALLPLRTHKATGQAYVNVEGRRVYLGKHDDPKTAAAYHRYVCEWLAAGQRAPVAAEECTVAELADRYLEHCDTYYRNPDGALGREYHKVKSALSGVLELYADIPAAEFSPLKLKAVRDRWIAAGLARTTINAHTGVCKRMFRWGVADEIVPAATANALDCVENLRKGRSKAKESRVIRAVPLDHVEAIRPHVSRQVWGLIQLQLHTGACSGEVLGLRRIDLDTAGSVWLAVIEHHKTSHHGKDRIIYFGERAQAVLREFFPGKGPAEYLFSPEDAEQERRESLHAKRRTPLSYGNRPGTNRRDTPERKPGDRYTPDSYRRAIERACDAAGVPRWHPHQLRHTAATRIRRELGLEAAQVWLGHSNARVTEIYAEVDAERAREIAAELG